MAIPNYYQQTGEGAIASYDYYDVQEGTGVKIFYAASSGALTTSYGILVTSTNIRSSGGQFTGAGGLKSGYETKAFCTTASEIAITKVYETSFNLPKIIKGNLYVNTPHRLKSSAGDDVRCWVIAGVYKNGALISSESSGAILRYEGSGAFDYSAMLINKCVVPKTKFKRDDILGIRIDVYSKATSATNDSVFLAHDPAARDPSSEYPNATTALNVHVPFVIDL